MEPQKPTSGDDTQLSPNIPVQSEQPAYTEPETEPVVEHPQDPNQSQQGQPQPISPATSAPAGDPEEGKTLAIVGLVLAIVGIQLVGLVLSIIALKKSLKDTTARTLAIVGLVLNIVFGLITAGFIAAVVLTAYSGVQQKALESQQRSEALQQQKQDESRIYSNDSMSQ